MLKHVLKIFILSAFLVMAMQSQTSAARTINCTFANYTGKSMTQLYFKYSSSNNWGRNFLRNGALKNGNYISAQYTAGYKYDIKIVCYDGTPNLVTRVYRNIYLSGQQQIWFDYTNGDIWAHWQ